MNLLLTVELSVHIVFYEKRKKRITVSSRRDTYIYIYTEGGREGEIDAGDVY